MGWDTNGFPTTAEMPSIPETQMSPKPTAFTDRALRAGRRGTGWIGRNSQKLTTAGTVEKSEYAAAGREVVAAVSRATAVTAAALSNSRDDFLPSNPDGGKPDGSDVNDIKVATPSGSLSSGTFDVPADTKAMQADVKTEPMAADGPMPTPERHQNEAVNEASSVADSAQGSADGSITAADVHQEQKVMAAEPTLSTSTLPISLRRVPQCSSPSDVEVALPDTTTVPVPDDVGPEIGHVRLASSPSRQLAAVMATTVGRGENCWEDGLGEETTPARPRQLAGTFEFFSGHCGGGEAAVGGREEAADDGHHLTPTEEVSR